MGVYINGMKMPETCIECMNSGLKTAIRCTEWTKTSTELIENRRAISCPLVEVSEPHERLIVIDADKLVYNDIDLPITVAEKIITGTKPYVATLLTKAVVKEITESETACDTVDMFGLEEIKEIANYLMVYYESHKEDK